VAAPRFERRASSVACSRGNATSHLPSSVDQQATDDCGPGWGPRPLSQYHVGVSAVPDEAAGEQDESAAPPRTARIIAFVAILVAGATGGFIGYAFVDLQCHNDCSDAVPGLGGLVGAVIAAIGVAVVAMLALRAMSEWRTIQETGDAGNWRD